MGLAMFKSWDHKYSISMLSRDLRQTEAKTLKEIEALNLLGNLIIIDSGNVTTTFTETARAFLSVQQNASKRGGEATKTAFERKKNIDKDQQKGTLEEPPALHEVGPRKKERKKESTKGECEGNAATPSIESKKEKPEASPDSRTAIDLLNQLSGKAFKHQPRSDLNARITENGVQPVLDVITAKCGQWNDDTKMRQYLRPETLFNRTKFEGYLEASKSQPTPAAKTRSPEDQAAYEARLLVGLNSNGTKWSPPE